MLFLLLSLLAINFITNINAFDCMNELGKPVDGWTIIKKPKGTEYFYYSENIFNISPYSLNDTTKGALAFTLEQLWESDSNYVIYNDQIPLHESRILPKDVNITATKYGHTKGLFAFNTYGGFILSHSIPLFPIGPSDTEKYMGISSNAIVYAQNMLCLSVDTNVIDSMSLNFLLNRPQIYDMKLLTDKYENINKLVNGEYSTVKLCMHSPFTTKKYMPFILYSKTAEWDNDLYSGCVTKYEKDTLWVESWIRGSAEGPVCPISDYDTLDIKYLDFGNDNSWYQTQDHSKWAITANKNTVCMGDINRMTTQYSRGGGTMCFFDDILHGVLKKATTKTNTCF